MSKKLNSLPTHLVESYFGTARSRREADGGTILRYYGEGYMADWLLNAAQKYKITNATLDIMEVKCFPAELNIDPLLFHLRDLNAVIKNNIAGNGLPVDFITDAKIEFSFNDKNLPERTFYAHPIVMDKEGKKYEVTNMPIKAGAYFDVEEIMSKSPMNKRKSFWKRLIG